MIISEKYNDILVRTYSDQDVKIIQVETGIFYDEAIDEMPSRYTYQETEIPKFELIDVKGDDKYEAYKMYNDK